MGKLREFLLEKPKQRQFRPSEPSKEMEKRWNRQQKEQIALGKEFSFTFFYGDRNDIIEQVGRTVVQDFSKIKQTTGTDQASLTVTCLPLITANILLRDRMMEFFVEMPRR